MKNISELIGQKQIVFEKYIENINKAEKGIRESDKRKEAKRAIKDIRDLRLVSKLIDGKEIPFIEDEYFKIIYDLKVCSERVSYIRKMRKSKKITESEMKEIIEEIKKDSNFSLRRRQKRGLSFILEEKSENSALKRLRKEYVTPDFEKDYLSRQMELKW